MTRFIPKVWKIKSVDYNKQQIQENACWKRYEVGVLIPLDDCNYVLEEVHSDQFERVVVNKEYFFTNCDKRLCKTINIWRLVDRMVTIGCLS